LRLQRRTGLLPKIFGLLLFGIWTAVVLQAQVQSLTVGIDATCPYGLIACWPGVLEGLRRVDGIKSVSEDANSHTWTCEIETKGGRMLDLQALARAIRGVGDEFSLRGVEATVKGWLIKDEGPFLVRWAGSGGNLELAPLSRKVQWDPRLKRTYPLSTEEKAAFGRLVSKWRGRPVSVRITGPLVKTKSGKAVGLEVRQFALTPSAASASLQGAKTRPAADN